MNEAFIANITTIAVDVILVSVSVNMNFWDRHRFPQPKQPLKLSQARKNVIQRTSSEHTTALNQEDYAAAQILHKLRGESFVALYDHLKRYNGSLFDANRALRQYAAAHPLAPRPLESTTPIRNVRALTPYEQKKKDELDAAMALLKLSGQSRSDTRAALALMMLKQESKNVLQNERQRQEEMISLAEVAVKKKSAADQFLALRQFRAQYPEGLRATNGVGGGDVRNVLSWCKE